MSQPPGIDYRPRNMQGIRNRMLFGSVLGWVLAGIALALGLVYANSYRQHNRDHGPLRCASNLSALYRALMLYADSHEGKCPPNLATLAADGDLEGFTLICPASAHIAASAATTQEWEARIATGNHLSYCYALDESFGFASLTADVIVAFEPLTNHGSTMNVLFGDGHVEMVETKRGQAIEADYRSTIRPLRSR